MTNEEAYPILSFFIEKSKKLENSNFVKRISNEFRLDIAIETGKPIFINKIGPDEENIDAFLLTYRLFIQDNENISIKNLAKLFNSTIANIDERDRFNLLRNSLNSFLSANSHLTIYNEDITNRDLMETFIYGNLSHGNNKVKKQKFDLWMSRYDAVDILWYKFSEIIFQVFSVIKCINNLCMTIYERISPQIKTVS
ncbi:MAG: hypothetical protein NTX45_09345 [Proteobacteria bacterium]|nr:hypothetical protein [Pseudomonadota bacterium]